MLSMHMEALKVMVQRLMTMVQQVLDQQVAPCTEQLEKTPLPRVPNWTSMGQAEDATHILDLNRPSRRQPHHLTWEGKGKAPTVGGLSQVYYNHCH